MKHIFLSLFIVIFLTSCSSLNKSYVNAPVNVEAKVKVDVNIKLGDEVTGTAETTSLFGLLTINGPTHFADNVYGGIKSAAAYNALDGTGADVIVNPQYTYEVNQVLFITTKKCTVKGVAGFVSYDK